MTNQINVEASPTLLKQIPLAISLLMTYLEVNI